MILITGDSGFIGQYLAKYLWQLGYSLRGIDIRRRIKSELDYPQIVGNILDNNAVEQAMKGVSCVIHLAAEHKDVGISREKYLLVNEEGTRCLLECATHFKVKKFMYYSSVAVYGTQQSATEETLPRPANHYGDSKLAAERVVTKWIQEDPTREVVIIRPTVVFGPFSQANIFNLIRYVCDGKFIWVGKGENIKSVAYVENLVAATHFLLERMKTGLALYNYSDEPQMTTSQLVNLIAEKAGVSVSNKVVSLSMALLAAKFFDIAHIITKIEYPISTARIKKFNTSTCYYADKIRSFGFTPPYSIEYGLSENVRWYLEKFKVGNIYETSEL
jgi:nucleoside-diphosphate-sugar epimerase